jgi:two-component system cell cycle sensor histidine kinase/response regulator CckA
MSGKNQKLPVTVGEAQARAAHRRDPSGSRRAEPAPGSPCEVEPSASPTGPCEITSQGKGVNGFRRVFEDATEGIYRTTPAGRFVLANPALARLLGYSSPQELIAGVTDIARQVNTEPDLRDEFKRRIEQEGEVRAFELQVRRKDGRTIWVSENAHAARDDNGAVLYYEGTIEDINARKQMELMSNRLAAIVESSDDAIIGKDLDGVITSWNNGAAKIFGYTAEEMVGTSITRLIPAERLGEERQILETIRRGESVEHFETARQTRDGRLIDVSVTASPIKDAAGKVVGVSKVARDNTALKRAEAALRENEIRIRSILESTGDGILAVDSEGKRVIKANRRFAEMWRIPQSIVDAGDNGALRDSVLEQLADPDTFLKRVRQYYASDKTGMDLLIFKDGRVFERHGFPMMLQGKVLGRVWSFRDITESKRAEAAVVESRNFLAQIINAVPNPIFVKDRQHRGVLVNDAFCRLTGLTREQLIGKADHDHASLTREQADVFRDRDERVFTTGKEDLNEETITAADGILHHLITKKALYVDEKGKKFIVGVVSDITERKQAEKELQQSRMLYESLVSQTPAGIFRKDAQGRFVFVNPVFCQLKNMNAEEILGKTPCEVDDYERAKEAAGLMGGPPRQRTLATQGTEHHEIIMRTGQRIEVEEVYPQPDGIVEYFDVVKSPVYDAEGRIIGSQGIQFDVTARKRAEKALQMFQFATDRAADAVFWMNRDGSFFYVNDQACRSLGYTREELMRRRLFDIDPVYSEERWQENWLQFEHDESATQRMESNHRRKDGSTFPVEILTRHFSTEGVEVRVAFVRDITGRKRVEETLRASEEKYRGLFEHMVEGFAYCEMIFENGVPIDWKYISVNRAFESLTGLKDVIGRRVTEVIPGITETDPDILQTFGRVSLTGKPDRHEFHVKALQQWFDVTAYSPGKGFFVAVFDVITGRKRAEERVADALNFNLTVLRTSPAGILVYKADGPCVSANEAAAAIVGCTQEQLLQQNFRRLESWKQGGMLDAAEAALAGGTEQKLEANLTSSFGKQSWLNCRFVPFQYANEPHLFMIITDITERKLADQFQARLATAVEQASETIMITDTRGVILYANPAFEKSTGYTRAEALGQNPRLLKSGKQDNDFYRQMWETIGRGEIWSGHFINRRKDGRLYEEEATISPVRDTAGAVVNFVAVKRDVTRERQLEAQMHQAQKMEAIGQLAGGVAHDFNNILGVIIGYSDLLALDLAPDSPLRSYVEEIQAAAGRASGLTRQLLLFSRKQKVEPVVLDLNEAVRDLDKMLRRLIGEHVEMTVTPGKELGHILADPGHVGQVLMNLVVNARDAMPNGGKLTIATANVTLDEIRKRPDCRVAPGNYVMLTVGDTGMGMTPEVKARLFEALFTTKPAGKGTGLGLATCQTIVQQSGGCIDVESEAGRGATFKIYFPRVDKPLETAARPARTGPLPRGRETLLLVEDEPSVRHLAAGVLETQGYTVLRANNGQEALNLVQSHKDLPIHLVVTDVVMPRMGGKMMAEWLKAAYPDLKVLFTSGYTDDDIAQQGVLEPGTAFLAKPYSPEALARKVRSVLDNDENIKSQVSSFQPETLKTENLKLKTPNHSSSPGCKGNP